MKKLLSIYKNIIVKHVSYEKGDQTVELTCVLVFKDHERETKLIISQSDFNRLLSKMILDGFDLEAAHINEINFGDGTEIVEYNFTTAKPVNKFNFNNHVKQISA
ncbi:MAG: hypothetical protein ACWA41_03400 [Putridiphycobacter sp.]